MMAKNSREKVGKSREGRLRHLENYLSLTAAFYSIDWIFTHGLMAEIGFEWSVLFLVARGHVMLASQFVCRDGREGRREN